MHSSRSASAASCVARSSAASARNSPNSTTSGFSGRPQAHSGTGACSSCASTPADATRSPHDRHAHVAIEPCTSMSSRVPARRCSMSMFCVMTASSSPRRSSSTRARCAPLGSLVAERLEAVAVEAPEALGIRAPGVDVRDLHRVDVLPDARARACGSPGSRRGPRSRRRSARRPTRRSARAPPGPRRRRGAATSRSTAACAYPGTRRSPRARPRSAKTSPNAAFSASMPSSRSASPAVVRLIAADRQRRLAAELARPGARDVVQLVVGHDAVDEPDLVGLVGGDRIAGEVELQRARRADEPRQPLRAAEAGDDPEVDLGLAEARRLRGDPHVAGHRELAAAAERDGVDRGDRHRRGVLHRAAAARARRRAAARRSARPSA